MTSTCPYRRRCAFFRCEMDNLPGTAGLYRRRYCFGRHSQCARYIAYWDLDGRLECEDLLPHQHKRAEAMVLRRRAGTLR